MFLLKNNKENLQICCDPFWQSHVAQLVFTESRFLIVLKEVFNLAEQCLVCYLAMFILILGPEAEVIK